jgi:hypothetical protein
MGNGIFKPIIMAEKPVFDLIIYLYIFMKDARIVIFVTINKAILFLGWADFNVKIPNSAKYYIYL